MIENKKIVAMILFLSLFFYNTLVTAYGGIPESKVTNNMIGTKNHHSISMDQSNNNATKGVSENVSIITNYTKKVNKNTSRKVVNLLDKKLN